MGRPLPSPTDREERPPFRPGDEDGDEEDDDDRATRRLFVL
jgi:hypothetical protein